MKNTDVFNDKVEESAEIKMEISDHHNKTINKLGKLFKHRFGRSPQDFKYILNMMFYKNGVPKESSTSRLSKLLANFILVVKYYGLLGKESEFDRILRNYGIIISYSPDRLTTGDVNTEKFEKLWGDVFGDIPIPHGEKDVLESLLEHGLEVRGVVNTLDNEVKEINAPDVEIKCEIGKSNFLKAVNIRTKKLRGKDSSNEIEKIKKDVKDLDDILEEIE